MDDIKRLSLEREIWQAINQLINGKIWQAINQLNNGKSPGSDNIPGELLKVSGEKGVHTLLNLCSRSGTK